MNNLKRTIESLASQFAVSLLDALRGASIDEILDVAHGKGRRRAREDGAPLRGKVSGGRLGRRSPEDIARTIDEIVGQLEAHPEGMRAEQIRAALGCEAKELPRPLAEAVSAGRITKSGQKRATTYYATGSGGAPKRRARRGSKKRRAA